MTAPFLSRDQVRAFDRHAIETLGIPSAVLMENAGRGAADVLERLGIHGPVVLCCGKGNNGGDGLVIARHLANRGFRPHILLFAKPGELSADAALQWNTVQQMRLHAENGSSMPEIQVAALLARADWVVDALFGTGLTGPLKSPFNGLVQRINASASRVFAIDIPSGLDCDTGEPLGPTIEAAHTVTFVGPKLGYRNPASVRYTGRVHVVDIGVA